MKEELRRELLDMCAEDLRVRRELEETGELGGPYLPRMEAVHARNASRLRDLLSTHGWPDESVVGKEGAEAAWLIVQHAIGDPALQRQALCMLRELEATNGVPRWHAAYLEDRIAMYEGRPQLYGTQWLDDSRDGRIRPWKLVQPDKVNEFRAAVGLGPLQAIPEPGPELSVEQQQEIVETRLWWERWLMQKGWRSSPGSNPSAPNH